MITIPNRIDLRQVQEEMKVQELKRLMPFGRIPEGYQPDEDDPAWPSKSGQAD